MKMEANTAETRDRLLRVASELFAKQGYAATSISEITRLAAANKASVNYHFGSKEGLYQQAWRHAHDISMKLCPPDDGVGADRPAAERLRGHIRAGVRRSMIGDVTEFQIMRNEMASPTGLLFEVIRDAIEPIRRRTQELLRELLGPKATDQDIAMGELNVVGPWLLLRHHKQAEKYVGLGPIFHEDMIDDMVEHFTTYALGGIREIRRRIEQYGDATPAGTESSENE